MKPHLESTFQDSSDRQQAMRAAQAAFMSCLTASDGAGSGGKDLRKLSACLTKLLKVKQEFAELNGSADVYRSARVSVGDPKSGVREVPLLHLLAQHCTDPTMVDQLLMPTLRAGLNLNVLDASEENVLHAVFKRRKPGPGCDCRLVKTLIQLGVKVAQVGATSGSTPLHYLVSKEQPTSCECIAAMVQAAKEQASGDLLHELSASGHSALHLAIIHNNPLYVKQLLDQGASPE